jgi:hypothetical protein
MDFGYYLAFWAGLAIPVPITLESFVFHHTLGRSGGFCAVTRERDERFPKEGDHWPEASGDEPQPTCESNGP